MTNATHTHTQITLTIATMTTATLPSSSIKRKSNIQSILEHTHLSIDVKYYSDNERARTFVCVCVGLCVHRTIKISWIFISSQWPFMYRPIKCTYLACNCYYFSISIFIITRQMWRVWMCRFYLPINIGNDAHSSGNETRSLTMIIEVIRIQFDTCINKIWSFSLSLSLHTSLSSPASTSRSLTHSNRKQTV